MKKRYVANMCKNALGTVLLLMGAFFVCSTLLSMRVVFADPIAPVNDTSAMMAQTQSPRSGRASPRGTSASNAARPTTATNSAATSRGVAARNVVSRTNSTATNSAAARTTTRNVVARTTANRATSTTRNVRSRTATTSQSRVALDGDPIRGARTKVNGSYYTYLSGKLYSGNYSNIIDSTTGLISADAYSNCLESYYTCMDEICTARNAAQRRCACAGRVKAFAEAEDALESANEELIKVSGELALLIANKGKEVSAAFSLTDAEKVMNCASWREASKNGTATDDEFGSWCADHGEFGSTSTCSKSRAPSYCYESENNYMFDVSNLDGAGSDILASLAKWADDVKSNVDTILTNDDDQVLGAISTLTGVINGITGSASSLYESTTTDTLAETWGYDLFRYAHNNVCARVLDSCFNGIYEGCGTPPSGGRCANGATSSCPFNYNSKVEISSSGDVTLNERSNAGANASASCFGYSSSSGDPYSSLRGPVADARRSVMQKYLLDANADCDLYGEQLKTTAQKISYQKVAAQQALQQKRLEFYNEEQNSILSNAIAAGTNFNECVSELWDCYETQASANENWSTSRIKTYCAQISNSPHCYQDMICNPSVAQFKAIIDVADNTNCKWHASDYTKNTCRNVVTLNEILSTTGTGASPATPNGTETTGNSAAFREQCLRDTLGCPGEGCIRTWTR
ncbi:MAG: hypothetical protein J5620_02680 [Alphaproteobacteria bacterium]|nr:hypothetical protein [Alphaproteobacteria bacterium]